MADAAETIATVRNISIIIAAAVVIIATLVMVAVLGAQRERQLREAVAEQAERMAVLKVRSTLHDGSKQAPAMHVRHGMFSRVFARARMMAAACPRGCMHATAQEAMAGTASKPAFQTLEDLMKPYKKHLLQSAFDLQSRLNGQVHTAHSPCMAAKSGFPAARGLVSLVWHEEGPR